MRYLVLVTDYDGTIECIQSLSRAIAKRLFLSAKNKLGAKPTDKRLLLGLYSDDSKVASSVRQ